MCMKKLGSAVLSTLKPLKRVAASVFEVPLGNRETPKSFDDSVVLPQYW